MKNITTALLQDPTLRKGIALIALNGLTVYLLYKNGFETGASMGGNKILEIGERMTPGFTEQFQKFISAERYGWKS